MSTSKTKTSTIVRHLPSPALIVACIALIVAFGGVSYAAVAIPKNSVGSAQVMNGSLQKVDLSKKTVAALHGAKGAQGVQGTEGPKGATGALLHAQTQTSPPFLSSADRIIRLRNDPSDALPRRPPGRVLGGASLDLGRANACWRERRLF
jgi:hypothetical protein